MENQTRELHFFLKFILYAIIVRQAGIIISSIMTLMTFGARTPYTLCTAVFAFFIIAASICVINKSKGGLNALFALLVLRLFILVPFSSSVSYSYYFGQNLVEFLGTMMPFVLALCFKENGINGWQFFYRNSENETEPLESDQTGAEISSGSVETPVMETIVDDSSQTTSENRAEMPKTPIQATKPVKSNWLTEYTGPKLKSILTYGLPSAIAVILFLVFVIPFFNRDVSTYGEKFKLTYRIPENDRVKALLDSASAYSLCPNIWILSNGELQHFFSREVYRDYFTKGFANINNVYSAEKPITSLPNSFTSNNFAINIGGSYDWALCDSSTISEKYERLMERYHSSPIYELEDVNLNVSLTNEQNYIDQASKIICSDYNSILQILSFYCKTGKFNLADEYLSSKYVKIKSNPKIIGARAYVQYKCLSIDNATDLALKTLKKDKKEAMALRTLALIYSEKGMWDEAGRYAKIAIDLGSQYPEPYFIYAMAMKQRGDNASAEDFYNIGCNLDPSSFLVDKYSECAGSAIKVHQIKVSSHLDSKVIIKPGDKLYHRKCYYLYFNVDCSILRPVKQPLYYKIYSSSGLSYNSGVSPQGYTTNCNLNIISSGEYTIFTDGWGSDTGYAWDAGSHRVEFWDNGEMIASHNFTIY